MNLNITLSLRRSGGFLLISTLLILIVLTFLGISMYHSFSEQEHMAANSKEKVRAFQVAQSTLQYAEYQLASNIQQFQQTPTCSVALTQLTVCQSPVIVQNPTSSNPLMSVTNGMTYSTMVPALTISTIGGTGTSGTYYANPQFYIQYLGLSPSGQGQIYLLTAMGYGGNANAVAVVQSTYQLTSGIKNLGGL